MTPKVFLKCSMKQRLTTLVSESPLSITCKSLIHTRVLQSKEKDNWTLNHPYSISSSSTMVKTTMRGLRLLQRIPQWPFIKLLTRLFNIDCFLLTKTSSEHVLRTLVMILMLIHKLSTSTSWNLLMNSIRMSIKLHLNQCTLQRWVSLPTSLIRPWWTKRLNGRVRHSQHR